MRSNCGLGGCGMSIGSEPGACAEDTGQEGVVASLLCPSATDGNRGKLGDLGGK